MGDTNQQKIYEFGDFRLIPVEGLLMRGSAPVQLTPKAFAALVLLVERRGRLVEKEELMKNLWDNAFVEESAVSKSVWAIRQALGEDPKHSKFIQTVPKRGYRFVADVSVIDTTNDPTGALGPLQATNGVNGFESIEPDSSGLTAEAVDQPAPNSVLVESEAKSPDSDQPTLSRTYADQRSFVALTGLALSALIFIGYLVFHGGGVLGKTGNSRIAVLPLKPLDSQTRDPLYEFGVADSLILKLGSSRNLAVRQLNAVRSYAGLDRDPIEIGNEQKVDYVLESHYQVVDGRIKVTSQLFRVASGEVEDTFTVERDAADPFSAQDAVANEVGNRILMRFGPAPPAYKPNRGTHNEEAYRLYLEAMYLYDKRGGNELRRAIDLLDRAVQLDPHYASAWAGKALASHTYSTPGISSSDEEHQISMEAANKALEIDPNLSDAHTAICQDKFLYEFDFPGAERECKRAVELDPNSPLAHQTSSILFSSRGRFDESISEIKIAIDLQPSSFNYQRFYGNVLYYARRYDEAESQFERVIAMNPSFKGGYMWLIKVLEMKGDEPKAFEVFIKYLTTQNPTEPKKLNYDEEQIQRYRTAYENLGWRGVMFERDRVFDRSNDPYFRRAEWNAMLGEKEKAVEYLRRSYELHEWGIAFLQVEPAFDPIRDDPRFNELVAKLR